MFNRYSVKKISSIYQIYIIGLLFYSLLSIFPYLKLNVSIIKYYPLLGLPIIILSFFCGNKHFNKISFLLFGGTTLSFLITTLKNLQLVYIQNIKNIFWMILLFFIIYSWDRCFIDSKQYYKATILIYKIFLVIFFGLNLVSFYMLINSIQFRYGGETYGWYPQGGRHFGIVPGTALIEVSVCSIFCCFIPLVIKNEEKISKGWKIVYILNFIFSNIFIMGGVSRTAYIGIFVIVLAILVLNYHIKTKCTISLKKLLYTGIIGIVVLSGVLLYAIVGRKVVSYIPRVGNVIKELYTVDTEVGAEVDKVDDDSDRYVQRKLTTSKSVDIRKDLSKVFYKIAKNDLVFGVGLGNNEHYLEKAGINKDTSVGAIPQLTYVFVCGIVGALFFYLACINIWIRALIFICNQDNEMRIRKEAIVLLALTGSGIIVTTIMLSFSGSTYIWWIMLSHLEHIISRSSREQGGFIRKIRGEKL